MKKGIWAPALAVICLLTACASIPTKSAQSDSLIVIKTEVSNPSGLPRGYEIVFHYSDDCKDSSLGESSWDYTFVVVKKPGVMLTSYSAELQPPFRGNSSLTPVNVALPYVPGGIVIADFVFMVKIEQTGMYEFSTGTGFRKISEQEKVDVMMSLKKDERFADWMRPLPEGPERRETAVQPGAEAQEQETSPVQGTPALPEKQNDLASTLPAAPIKIDGNFDDWQGIQPLIVNSRGTNDNRTIRKVSLASDAENLFIRLDIAETTPVSFFHSHNFDEMRGTGLGRFYAVRIDTGESQDNFNVLLFHYSGSSNALPSPGWYSALGVRKNRNLLLPGFSSSNWDLCRFQMKGSTVEIAVPWTRIQDAFDGLGPATRYRVIGWTAKGVSPLEDMRETEAGFFSLGK